ncbi:hypothetical protein [Mycobacterium sp. 94-17]|uniref:ATP-binding protein n=1 Tax=Mycobacterium sp. 94-17 TaxID=2986147 RepID=UPI002D76AD16|nr:hypothetical protein [Mycobacterium sp. 94-17]
MGGAPLDVTTGADSAGVTLFVERARSVAQRFSLAGADDAATVVDICRQLDGIPLAIELAASRMASMTPGEVRDRLGQRFRLLVGSGRGLPRHQTLRHAVAWSYDYLDEAEKSLLERCSVFAGGFDLESACAVAAFEDVDDYVVLDLLDALVRKSLLVADRSSGRTRFSMLETIRQFAEEQLIACGEAAAARAAHARCFAGRERDIAALWNGPRQRQAYDWFAAELANLRAAFRWAVDQGDLDVGAPIAILAAWLGFQTENYEPIGWAEELIEPARAVNHPRLAALYVMASNCYMAGRVDPAIHYTEVAERAISVGSEHIPYGAEGYVGGAYVTVRQPDRWIRWLRSQLARGPDDHAYITANLLIALSATGAIDEAMAAAAGLIDAAEATGNPQVLSSALQGYSLAVNETDPLGSLAAMRRALVIAQDSGNRANQSHIATNLCRVEAEHGDPLAALDYFAMAIANYRDSGNTYMIGGPLASLATFFDRLGRYESAATIAGFAVTSPIAELALMTGFHAAIEHLRGVLGEVSYESLARTGATLTTTAMATYAYDQIDQARTELEQRAGPVGDTADRG